MMEEVFFFFPTYRFFFLESDSFSTKGHIFRPPLSPLPEERAKVTSPPLFLFFLLDSFFRCGTGSRSFPSPYSPSGSVIKGSSASSFPSFIEKYTFLSPFLFPLVGTEFFPPPPPNKVLTPLF